MSAPEQPAGSEAQFRSAPRRRTPRCGGDPEPDTSPSRLPGGFDPVLAFLDFVARYRRSWRCWLIGGPAAVDDLSLYASNQMAGIRIQADFQVEVVQRRWQHATGRAARRILWYNAPEPHPPREGTFEDREEAFPLVATRVVGLCELCYGSGRRRCGTCGGTGRNTVDPPLGSIPCDGCGGKGGVPCRCGERVARQDLVCYEEEVYTYRHERQEFEVVSDGAEAAGIQPLLRRARRAGAEHLQIEAATGAELAAKLDKLPGLGEDVRRKVQKAWASLCRHAGELARSRNAQIQCRILHQHSQARVTHAAMVCLRQGTLRRRLWVTGTRRRCQAVLQGPEVARVWWLLPTWTAWLGLIWVTDAHPLMLLYSLLYGARVSFNLSRPTATAGTPVRLAVQSVPAFFGYLRAGPKAVLPAEVVVASPQPAASARLFALLAHLAAHAALADPHQGGAVPDDVSLDLWRMLHAPAEVPAGSGTYRLVLGAAVPGPERLRIVHLVGVPEDEPDDLCRAALGRAAQVWLVLPADVPAPEVDRWASRMLGASGDAAIALVRGGDAPGLDDLPGTRARLAGRQHRVWHTDLNALAARYTAGQVSAGEAAGLVRWLAAGEEQPPAAVEAASDPEASPNVQPAGRART